MNTDDETSELSSGDEAEDFTSPEFQQIVQNKLCSTFVFNVYY